MCDISTSNCQPVQPDGNSKFIITYKRETEIKFETMSDYLRGKEIIGATQLKLSIDTNNSSCKWKLIMIIRKPENNTPPDKWDNIIYYGTSGNLPDISLLEVKVYNGCGTPVNNGIYQHFNSDFDIIEIIPELPNQNFPGNCDGSQVNTAGSYLTNYNEYNFMIDYRIRFNLNNSLRPGAYKLNINFCLAEVP